MKRNFIFFIGTLKEGGAERVLSILSQSFVKSGNDVTIVMYYDSDVFYDFDKNVKLISIEKETGTRNVLRNCLWFRNYCKKISGVVISFLAPFNILAILSNLFLKNTLIVADRNDPRYVPSNKITRIFRNVLYRFADGVVLQTENNRKYFSEKIQKKSTVIYNPVDLGEKAGKALTEVKKNTIVSVGRLVPQKNQKLLIEAFAEIHTEFPDYDLCIYGEGSGREELEKTVTSLNLKESVKLPGSTKNVHEYIISAKLFVLSSNYEGMPNALIEAMCLGLPVISTKVSGAVDLIIPGINGELVEIGNKDELISTIKLMLSNPMKSNLLATEATILNRKLSVKAIIDQWERFIEKVDI